MGKDQPNPKTAKTDQLSLNQANQRLEDITRLVSDWVWEVDHNYNISYVSERVFENLGYHPRELIGKPLAEFINFETSPDEDLNSTIQRPFRDKAGTAVTKGGVTCHVLFSGVPVFNFETGDFEGVRGTADDVTAKIQAETKLRESEQHYRSLIEVQRTGILVLRNYEIVFANASAVRMFGAETVDDLLGRTSLELTHPDYHEIIKSERKVVENELKPKDFIELVHRRLDGTEFYSLDNAAPITWENEAAVIVSISDNSETKAAEKAAAESENRFKEFAESAADIFWETDENHRYTFMSPPLPDMVRLRQERPIGKTPWEQYEDETNKELWAEHRADLAAHKPFRNLRHNLIDVEGKIRYVCRNGTPQFNEEGNFIGYRGTIVDETDLIVSQEKIADIQQQFFAAIENFSEGFALWDEQNMFVYCNSFFRLKHAAAQTTLLPGHTYEDFIRGIAKEKKELAPENVNQWVKDRLNEFKQQSSSYEELRKNEWIQVRKHKLSNGSSMVLFADITEHKLREQALHESEYRLRLITDAIPAMIAYHDCDLKFQFANKNFESIGLNPEKIIGKSIPEVFPPENLSIVMPEIDKVLEGESVTYDNFFTANDGKNVYTQVSIIPDFNDHGDVQGMFVLSFDITERKKAESEIAQSNAALDAAQSIAKIGSWDRDNATGKINWSNEHYRIFGLDSGKQEITRELFYKLVHPDDMEKIKLLTPDSDANLEKRFSVDFRIIRQDGTERFIHGEREPVFDLHGNPIGVRGVSQDITERKRTEEALDKARQEAEFANKAKSEFLSSMSHELRTPMNAILGYAQLLMQTKKDPLQGRQVKQVNQILLSGQHLLKLINDILDLAKIESGHVALELTEVNILATLGECIELISSLAERHEISIKSKTPPDSNLIVRADLTRFKQAILNLLSNAIKYNKPSGEVEVSYRKTLENNIRISVEDNGIGIPMERQVEIFEPFSRLGAEQKGIEGTGIGLTITKQLVELMEGKIGFYSSYNEGSTFWIELPMSSAETDKIKPTEFTSRSFDTFDSDEKDVYIILYIEDDTSNLHLMEEVIDNVPNLTLLTATSAEDGLEIARSKIPDVIFMDINLPGMSGLDAMRFLQGHNDTRDIPVIALSAAAMPHDLEKGRKAGFFNYLTKPFDIEEVLSNINDSLKLDVGLSSFSDSIH